MFKSLIKSSIKDYDGQGRIVVAANAFGNIDSDRDISMPGSFDRTIKENWARVKWFLNHDRTQLLGVPLKAYASDDYLTIEGQLNMQKQIGRDTYEDYKLYAEHGMSLEHSIGVDPIKYLEDRDNGVRKVTEWKLWEYSTLTSWGANERTPMLEMKSASILSDINLLEIKLKKGKYSDERFIEFDQALTRLKSLLTDITLDEQPVPADALAGLSKDFLTSLT